MGDMHSNLFGFRNQKYELRLHFVNSLGIDGNHTHIKMSYRAPNNWDLSLIHLFLVVHS
jgi:hypothetical protein